MIGEYLYVVPEELNPRFREFTVETRGEHLYLKFGLVNEEDTAILEAIDDVSYIGFFVESEEVSNTLVVSEYSHTGGFRVHSLPAEISYGNTYHICWDEERPDRPDDTGGDGDDDGDRDDDDTPPRIEVQEQGVIRYSVAANLMLDVQARLHFDYRVVDANYESFRLRFYPSANDFDTDRPIPEGDPRYPADVRIVPPTPFTTAGHYIHDLYFTPTYSGDIFIGLDLVESDEWNTRYYQLVDVNNARLVDANDKTLTVSTLIDAYQLVDTHDTRIIDVNDNTLVGFL